MDGLRTRNTSTLIFFQNLYSYDYIFLKVRIRKKKGKKTAILAMKKNDAKHYYLIERIVQK